MVIGLSIAVITPDKRTIAVTLEVEALAYDAPLDSDVIRKLGGGDTFVPRIRCGTVINNDVGGRTDINAVSDRIGCTCIHADSDISNNHIGN
jgi:hypothetical protein